MASSIPRAGSGASIALSPSVRAMTTKSGLPRSSATARAMRTLPQHLIDWDQRLAADVTAPLGEDLVLQVSRGHACVDVKLGGPLYIEDVAVAAVHVDDDQRDVQGSRGDTLLGIAHRIHSFDPIDQFGLWVGGYRSFRRISQSTPGAAPAQEISSLPC